VKGLLALAMFAAVTATGSAATAATPAGGSITVTGFAGTMTDVTLPTEVRFTVAGQESRSTADRGGWSGVVMVAANGGPAERSVLLSAALQESFRCPAARCPYTAAGPPVQGTYENGSDVVLRPGRYHVVLAGAAGAHIRVQLTPRGLRARRTLATDARPVRYVAEVSGGMGPATHETQLHTFTQMPGGGRFGLAALFDSIALDPVGAVVGIGCITGGSSNMTTRSVGGVAPCEDRDGDDFVWGPYAGPTADRVAGAYAPVQVTAIAQWGPSGASFGMGYDQSAVAETSFLRSVFIGIETG
jgi:hypothetical protein